MTPIEARIEALPGARLVAPVILSRPPAGASDASVTVRLGDSPPIQASLVLYRISDTPFPEPHSEVDPLQLWLGPNNVWSTQSAADPSTWNPAAPPDPARSFWAVVIDLPPNLRGITLRFSDRTVPVQWLPSVPAPLPAHPLPSKFAPTVDRLSQALANNPSERWRVHLLRERLPASADSSGAPNEEREFTDPYLEALALQTEGRWRAALARLAAREPDLAARILDELTAIDEFAPDQLAPIWSPTSPRLLNLLDALLDPTRTATGSIDRARSWLDSIPRATPWIIDDAGTRATPTRGAEASWAPIVAIGVADRIGKRDLVWLTGVNAPGSASPLQSPLSAWSSAVAVATIAATTPLVPIDLHIGEVTQRLLVLAGRISASPPGASLAPLVQTWTLPDWQAGVPRAAEPEHATAALLQRSTKGDAWELYVECRIAPGERVSDADRLTVFLGPTSSPASVIQVKATDAVAAPDRWTTYIAIPPEAIAPDSTLQIGLLRTDSRGRRSSWPRPMLPWQESPGRAAINLSTWTEAVR